MLGDCVNFLPCLVRLVVLCQACGRRTEVDAVRRVTVYHLVCCHYTVVGDDRRPEGACCGYLGDIHYCLVAQVSDLVAVEVAAPGSEGDCGEYPLAYFSGLGVCVCGFCRSALRCSSATSCSERYVRSGR